MTENEAINYLTDRLSIEEKAAQLMVLGYTGIFVEPELLQFISQYGLGGLRLSPRLARKFIRYLPDGSPGLSNVLRSPTFREKVFNNDITPPHISGEAYAGILNSIRKRAFDKQGIPLHTVMDCESGGGSNFIPKGFVTTPAPMGFGDLGDLDLIRRSFRAVGEQLKCIGIDMIHSPVVDVNTNPKNPEIYTRSFSADHEQVVKCARASLEGLKESKLIGCLKHFPGRGASDNDPHYGMSSINLDRDEFFRVHLAPYTSLNDENLIPAVMIAHTIYPKLDPSEEIATVSKAIINGILRQEIGYDGVVTTDSITMGGLMAKYSVGEACVKALEAGADLLLLKDDNSLRWEMHAAIVAAIKSGRIPENRIDESLRRIWSLKWEYGLFDNGGIVDTSKTTSVLENPKYRKIGLEAGRRVIRKLRDRQHMLPLKKSQNILIVDRVTSTQLECNDMWNYPGMLWEFILRHSPNTAYVDYTPETIEKCESIINDRLSQTDIILVTADFNRNDKTSCKKFLRRLKKYGKRVVLASSVPYEELLVPNEIDTVVVTYGLMRDNLESLADYLFDNVQPPNCSLTNERNENEFTT